MRAQRILVAAMRVQQHDPPEAMPQHRAHDALDQRGEGGVVQRDRCRRNSCDAPTSRSTAPAAPRTAWPRAGDLGAVRAATVSPSIEVDLDRQMRAVLFQRCDGQDDDRVPLRQVPQLVGPQFAPFGLGPPFAIISPVLSRSHRATESASCVRKGRPKRKRP